MCCGNKNKGIKPNKLAALRKRAANTSKYSASKKTVSNGKRN